MRGSLETAGERLAIECAVPWVGELLTEGAGGELRPFDESGASVHIRVEADRRPFETDGWEVLTRGAWRRAGSVVVANACTAGFDTCVRCTPDAVEFTFRWRPPPRDRAAARILRSRFHLLARAVLLQYPALWWAQVRGRAPLHASALTRGGRTPLVCSASGVGRSTLVLAELAAGAHTTGDNLCVGDGTAVWGLVEPVRVEGAAGRRMPHGRSEASMRGRVESLVPDTLVILERGHAKRPAITPSSPEAAANSLAAATYMAGELRRYWAFAATLSAGTGVGPPHAPLAAIASAFAATLPCYALALGEQTDGERLSELLASHEVAVSA